MANVYLWVIVRLLRITLMKHLTSVCIRALTERDQQKSTESRHVLAEAAEKESKLKSETEKLQIKLNAFKSVVGNLLRSIQQGKRSETVVQAEAEWRMSHLGSCRFPALHDILPDLLPQDRFQALLGERAHRSIGTRVGEFRQNLPIRRCVPRNCQ